MARTSGQWAVGSGQFPSPPSRSGGKELPTGLGPRPSLAGAIGVLAGVAALLVAPEFLSSSLLSLAISWAIFATLVYGVDLVHGAIGYLSLAHVGLWGIAAYTMLSLRVHLGLDFWLASLVGLVACVIAAAFVASFAFRTAGYYFAILTFAASELIRLGFANLKDWTGGNGGIFLFDRPSVFGMELSSLPSFGRLSIVALLVSMVFVFVVNRSSFGWKCKAVGENENLAEALGISTYRMKVGLFVLSALPTGLSGILFATYSGAIQPDLFGPQVSIGTILMAILGGTGYLAGPLIGAAVYVFTPDLLPFGPVVGYGALGVVLIGMMRASREGMAPQLEKLAPMLLERLRLHTRPGQMSKGKAESYR